MLGVCGASASCAWSGQYRCPHFFSAPKLFHRPRGSEAALTIGAIGVVFGDIGTSPLYAVDQVFYGPARLTPAPENILGCISLVIWALTLIVSCKYAAFVLRANSDGEGGVFALYSLLHKYKQESRYFVVMLAGLMLGAGFLFGDGIITPAISVLSAVDGLKVATPMFAGAIVPVTVVILAALFAVQHKGTAGVGRISARSSLFGSASSPCLASGRSSCIRRSCTPSTQSTASRSCNKRRRTGHY